MRAIETYVGLHNGISPTYRELEKMTGLIRPMLQKHIRMLVRFGYLTENTPPKVNSFPKPGRKWKLTKKRYFDDFQ
jgi:hypothetical protein